MDKFLSHLLEKYGLLPIAMAVIIGAVIVWSFAHFTAAPGGNVSVLWGLVQYTKANSPDDTRETPSDRPVKQIARQNLSENQKLVNLAEPTPGVPANATVIRSVTDASIEPTLKALRLQRHLRALETLESGRRLADTPRETYFFVWKGSLCTSKDEKGLSIEGSEVSRFRTTKSYFEVHLPSDGPPIIVAFASESDAVRYGARSSEIQRMSLASIPWEKMTSLVLLPTSRIVQSKLRTLDISERESIDILDIQIR